MDSFQSNIYNTDQSGFNYEMHSGRTLDFKGVKDVSSLIQSSSALTHSYTIQPLIKIDGTLHERLLVCLQEKNGFPKTKVPLNPSNIYLKCSSSGKLTKQIIFDWYDHIFFPEISSNSDKKGLLLYDSWTGFGHKEDIISRRNDIQVSLEIIPPKTTSMIQPLDVFFLDHGRCMFEQYLIILCL